MVNVNVFKDASIDEDQVKKALKDSAQESRGNPMPKGVVSLEKFNDLQNHFKGLINTKSHSSTLSPNN